MSKRIMVTGSEGLIGKAITTKLSRAGYAVCEVDLRRAVGEVGCIDTRDSKKIFPLLQSCHGIIHLAAVSRVVWGQQDPEKCHSVNVEATEGVVDMALKSPLKPWVIFGSSREVYGQQEVLPVNEDAELKPMNHYARSKVLGEEILNRAFERGLRGGILRFSNVFGSLGDHVDRVIPAFCRAAISGAALRVEGYNHTFDFTYIDDVADGIMRVVNKYESGTKQLLPIHFTSGKPTTLGQAAQLICKIAESESEILEGTPRSFDVEKFVGDSSRAGDILNWSPKVQFEEGVKLLIKKLSTLVSI